MENYSIKQRAQIIEFYHTIWNRASLSKHRIQTEPHLRDFQLVNFSTIFPSTRQPQTTESRQHNHTAIESGVRGSGRILPRHSLGTRNTVRPPLLVTVAFVVVAVVVVVVVVVVVAAVVFVVAVVFAGVGAFVAGDAGRRFLHLRWFTRVWLTTPLRKFERSYIIFLMYSFIYVCFVLRRRTIGGFFRARMHFRIGGFCLGKVCLFNLWR